MKKRDSIIIIAEAGVNHCGHMELARRMVKVAADAGADYVKFQTAVPELVISSTAPKADYQKTTTGSRQSQLDMCRAIHLPLSAYIELKELCRNVGIGFMSTPFDLVSIDYLSALGQDWMKIPSGEITNLPYLRRIALAGIPVIMSTGMSTLEEISTAVDVLTGVSDKYPSQSKLTRNDIILLHCNTEYPTPLSDVNLLAMKEMERTLGLPVGYSDHTLGIEVPIAAAALGAVVIEKHFTLSRALEGPDHRASLEPKELAEMVRCVRNIEKAVGGTSHKQVSPSERKNMPIARKSIVAARDIKAGEIFTADNITCKRPGNGISPMLWDSVVGSKAKRDFSADSLIEI